MSTNVRVVSADELLGHAPALRTAYREAFSSPPWNEGEEEADGFLDRLARDIARPGFTAALAHDGREVLGFATAWTTPAPFPSGRCYGLVQAALGPGRTDAWLCGAREVDELAVRPTAQGTGVATGLLDAVTSGAPGNRAWLLTSVQATQALRFYRRRGWTQATHPADDSTGITVLLGPRHPDRAAAARPL
ncbi:GNAT family N-acetyltransferase [Streptomyces sp. NPDC046977]|uniref:GNAT family N-acetyltransferase n=1 Tax=Streptomyces sp. NPDC046977 TaxID=3154703 RepID=UPI003403278C